MGQDYIWNYFQNENQKVFEQAQSRLDFLIKKVGKRKLKKPKVLNIGVGDGYFEKTALARGFDIYAVDPDKAAIKSIREKYSLTNQAKQGGIDSLPFEDSMFDFCIASEVFEHLKPEELTTALREIKRVLRPGGRLLGTVPARENLNAQLVVCPKCSEKFHRWGHEQTFGLEKIKETLLSQFKIEEVRECLFVNWKTLNWKGRIPAALKYFLKQMGSKVSGANIYFCVQK